MTTPRARILLVDDSAMQRAILARVLEQAGYEVVTADGGAAGIARAFDSQPDAIVCDVMMPEVSGYHLCRFVKNDKTLNALPVILLTGSAVQKADRFWGLKSGADAYLTKEEDPAPLLEALDGLLRRRDASAPDRAVPPRPQVESGLHVLFDKLLFETTVANELRSLSALVSDREALLAELATLGDALFDVDAFAVAILQADAPFLHIALKETVGPGTVRAIRRAIAQVAGERMRELEPKLEMTFSPPHRYDAAHLKLASRAPLACPLVVGGEVIGAVCVVPAAHAAEPTVDLCFVARELAPVAGTLTYYTVAHRLAVTDGLTGLHNARFMLGALDTELARCRRHGRTFSLVILDLDGFKQINDVHGHLAGDHVLKGVARVLTGRKRRADITARYGGDEFMLLLPETDLAGAVTVAERLRVSAADEIFAYGDKNLRITASIGVAELDAATTAADGLIAAADRALYASKAAGRNAVHAWRDGCACPAAAFEPALALLHERGDEVPA